MSELNSYPLQDNRIRQTLIGTLSELTPVKYHEDQVIDITYSPIIPAYDLQRKLSLLQQAAEQDVGLPIISQGALIGFIPAVTLESALNKIGNHAHTACLICTTRCSHPQYQDVTWQAHLTSSVDPVSISPTSLPSPLTLAKSPIALEANTPLQIAHDCFRKLGFRYLCVVQNGRYVGLVSCCPVSFMCWVRADSAFSCRSAKGLLSSMRRGWAGIEGYAVVDRA